MPSPAALHQVLAVLLEQAVAGEALDPAVVLRLSDLLSGRPSSSFPGYPT
jgi:hypothetical protein